MINDVPDLEFKVIGKVKTCSPSRYLKMLCKHWSQKLAVRYDDKTGDFTINDSYCHLEARQQEGLLLVQIATPDAQTGKLFMEVVARHLEQLGACSEPGISWESYSE